MQKNRTEWEVLVETAPHTPEEGRVSRALSAIVDRLAVIVRLTFGNDCRVETQFVDSIPRVRGKLRYYRKAELPEA